MRTKTEHKITGEKCVRFARDINNGQFERYTIYHYYHAIVDMLMDVHHDRGKIVSHWILHNKYRY